MGAEPYACNTEPLEAALPPALPPWVARPPGAAQAPAPAEAQLPLPASSAQAARPPPAGDATFADDGGSARSTGETCAAAVVPREPAEAHLLPAPAAIEADACEAAHSQAAACVQASAGQANPSVVQGAGELHPRVPWVTANTVAGGHQSPAAAAGTLPQHQSATGSAACPAPEPARRKATMPAVGNPSTSASRPAVRRIEHHLPEVRPPEAGGDAPADTTCPAPAATASDSMANAKFAGREPAGLGPHKPSNSDLQTKLTLCSTQSPNCAALPPATNASGDSPFEAEVSCPCLAFCELAATHSVDGNDGYLERWPAQLGYGPIMTRAPVA